MFKFLKGFGLGLLYALLLPFMVVGFALIAVFYGIPNFLVKLVKVIINFFKGIPLFPNFQEDEDAEKILLAKTQAAATVPTQPTPTTNVYLQTNYYPGQGQPAPQPQPMPQPAPQPTYIDTTAAQVPPQQQPSQISHPNEAIFGGDLLTNNEEDKQ